MAAYARLRRRRDPLGRDRRQANRLTARALRLALADARDLDDAATELVAIADGNTEALGQALRRVNQPGGTEDRVNRDAAAMLARALASTRSHAA